MCRGINFFNTHSSLGWIFLAPKQNGPCSMVLSTPRFVQVPNPSNRLRGNAVSFPIFSTSSSIDVLSTSSLSMTLIKKYMALYTYMNAFSMKHKKSSVANKRNLQKMPIWRPRTIPLHVLLTIMAPLWPPRCGSSQHLQKNKQCYITFSCMV
jgi:hypothetical protein